MSRMDETEMYIYEGETPTEASHWRDISKLLFKLLFISNADSKSMTLSLFQTQLFWR